MVDDLRDLLGPDPEEKPLRRRSSDRVSLDELSGRGVNIDSLEEAFAETGADDDPLFLGMTAAQRAVVSGLIFFVVLILGILLLAATGRLG